MSDYEKMKNLLTDMGVIFTEGEYEVPMYMDINGNEIFTKYLSIDKSYMLSFGCCRIHFKKDSGEFAGIESE